MTRNLLDQVYIKEPCNESWEQMTGNNEVRFCSHCAKNVYDLSGISRSRAERLLQASGGNLCARYVTRRSDVVAPPNLLTQITRRATFAAGVLASSLAMSSFVSGQSNPSGTSAGIDAPRTEILKMTPRIGDSIVVSGVVHDPSGAVVPGATVVLSSNTGRTRSTVSDAEGSFVFRNVDIGEYELEITAPGFVRLIRTSLEIKESLTLTEKLSLDENAVLLGVVGLMELPLITTSDAVQTTTEPLPRSPEPLFRVHKTPRKQKNTKNSLPK